MTYDSSNVFARILKGEIPCKKLHEDAHSLAFPDISPKADLHVLVLPKGSYVDFSDFTQNASDEEIVAWVRAINVVAQQHGMDKTGFRLIVNQGANGGQEVPHLHAHVLGGQKLGSMLPE
ncbi:MAG: HIT domain-containing protein [Alphaproteobacteria bacterium]|nr:MAG: HIT domain-containing protein [Alphaproteobacteria bacterium]